MQLAIRSKAHLKRWGIEKYKVTTAIKNMKKLKELNTIQRMGSVVCSKYRNIILANKPLPAPLKGHSLLFSKAIWV